MLSLCQKTTIDNQAREVLEKEADALSILAANIPEDFSPAVQRILSSQGRLIVSGVGKSGHIGRKIAATLASTGTPSYFVHACEASHGDLGMITQNDICLLISNSGETGELKDLIYHATRFGIAIIGISSNPDSTLMKAANFRLTLPKIPEACSVGMAPTTSTTMTLGLGDALAIALMEQRGFAKEDFNIFHPGGKLGAQMKTVGEIMHEKSNLPLVDKSMATMQEVILAMTAKGLGIAALVDGNQLIGVISDGDLRRNSEGLMDHDPLEIVNRSPITVKPDCLASKALALANEKQVNALLVVDSQNFPVGVVHVHDFLRIGLA